jgi:hypothetical protein
MPGDIEGDGAVAVEVLLFVQLDVEEPVAIGEGEVVVAGADAVEQAEGARRWTV